MGRVINLDKQFEGIQRDIEEVLEAKVSPIRDLNGKYTVRAVWDFSKKSTEDAVFMLEISGGGLKETIRIPCYKTHFTNFLRAV